MPDPVPTLIPAPPWWRHRVCRLRPVTLLIALALWRWHALPLARNLWIGVNAILGVAMILWAIGFLPVTFKVRGSILRWAFWPSLLATFLQPGGTSGATYLVSLLGVFPMMLLVALAIGVMGAGGGVMAAESSADRVDAARSGIRWIWILMLVAGVLHLILPEGKGNVLVPLSGPWLFLCLHPFVARGKRLALIGRLDLWLARRLRWRIFGRSLDLRAEAFAAAGFLLAWALVSLNVFAPLQASSLLSTIQVINASGVKPAPKAGNLVLLEWDSATLRSATTRESEAAIQAKLILRISELGARRVVLPTPAEKPAATPDEAFEPVDNEEGPIPELQDDEARRTERDISALQAAMKVANNVVLIAPPPNTEKGNAFKRLKPFAREVVSSRFTPFQSAALPAIPFRWANGEFPAAPLALFAAQRPGEVPALPVISDDGTVSFDGRKFPLIDREGNVLVDLIGSRGSRDFAHVSYSEVLRGEWQFAPPGDTRPGEWVPPEIYFRDKIVFLPPLRSTSVPGPLGPLETTELLAHATRTLSGDTFLHPVPRNAAILWSFSCALAIGRLTMRRDPLKAGWRLIMALAIVIAASLLLAGVDLWLDPVWPAAATVASFLLVTQLSFSLERAAKERNRFLLHRFVDPEIARELVDSQHSRLGLGGDRENVVILFADVRGFSKFAENHPPEEVMRVVNAYLGVMTDALHARGGLLDKYTGDGLMAMFRLERNATLAGAVETALAMRDATLTLSRELKAEGEKSLRVGISMHAGEAVVGLIGNSERQVNFTALGHTVVVAARLQSLTGGGEVIVSKDIHDAVSDLFQMEPRPEVIVKGISQPVQPYVVLGK